MAETPQEKKVKKSSAINWYVWMIVILILVIIAGMATNICIMNKQFKKNEAPISNSKQVNNPLKTLKADSTKTIKLKEEDLQKFNDHIDYLSDKVEAEVKRTQDNTQYDIDRINVMLAIGIGLLTIIGGLLPIAVNFISKHDIDSKINNIESRLGDSATAIKAAEEKMPVIDMLILQNAVAKITSEDAWALFAKRNKPEKISLYFENIRLAFESFHDNLHSFEEYNNGNLLYFKNIISELKSAIALGPIRNINGKKDFQKAIDKLAIALHFFESAQPKDFKAQLKAVSKILSELKELVEKKENA